MSEEREERSFGSRETLRSAGELGSIGDGETLRDGAGWGILEEWGGKRWAAGEEILGRYVVERELGQGGMGVVYACFDKVGGVRVAVKALPPELSHNSVEMEEVRENFELVYHLSHPNIAGVKTLERDGKGEYFLVMELAEGEPIRRWMRRKFKSGESEGGSGGRGVPLTEVLPVLRQVAAALDYAHSKKVVHRDVKPGNVVIDGKGDVKVLDFGLAAQIRTSLSRASQAYRGTSGTGPYMSPEQWEGQPQGGAADQYALAVMAYEMLAGRLPFENSEPAVLREAVLKGEARTIPGLPKAAMAALRRGMAKKPAGRFGSCGEFTSALAGDKDSRGGRHPFSSGSRSRPWAIFGGSVLMCVLAGILFWQSGLFDRRAGSAFARCRQDLEQTRDRAVRFSGDDHLGWVFAAHRDDLQAELLRGESAMGNYDLQAAQTACRKARRAADWLEKQHDSALSAVEARKAAEKAADQAREAGADRFAEKTFREAATGEEKALLAFEQGDFAAAQRKWKEADRTYRRAEKEAHQWRRDDLKKRVQSLRERTKVHRAVDLGKTFQDKAIALEKVLQRAEKVFDGDEFDRAESVLGEATTTAEWLEKNSVAGGKAAAARSKAQAARERAEKADAARLAAVDYDRGAECAGNAATAFEDARFEDAQREWADAEAAFRNAAEQARETQKRNRESKVEKALEALRRAKEEGAWEKVAAAAGRVLELDAGNGEAKRLQDEAEKQLKPRLAVSAVWPDRTPATGAALQIGSTTTPLPHSFDCSASPVFGPGEAILEKGGKTHVGSLDRMEVDWKGEKAVSIALKERKAETAARPKGSPRPRLPKEAGARWTVRVGALKIALRWCPADGFSMGSAGDGTGKSTDGTPHPMTMQGFWMGETEVTQGLWKEVTGENPSFFKTGDDYPVENVSWEDCQMFVQAINEKHGQAGFVWALPTEAQWERACRAGTDTVYCWGNAPDRDKANYGGRRGTGIKGSHSPGTKPVGSYAANAWGLHDMHGNVWEWCGDGHWEHSVGAVKNPAGASSGSRHVYRGGSWLFDERDCQSASRAVGSSGYHYSDLGLRLALVPEP